MTAPKTKKPHYRFEKAILKFIDNGEKFVWDTDGKPARCRVTHYYEGGYDRSFVSVTVATDRLGWINSDIINGLVKITGATHYTVGTCSDAVWSEGVNICLILPPQALGRIND
jgi:hypothetical protein